MPLKKPKRIQNSPVKKLIALKSSSSIQDETALALAVESWANQTTNLASDRRDDLLRDKQKAVRDFFAFANLHPFAVRPKQILAWRKHLEKAGLQPNTIYALVSRISSFYRWLMSDPAVRRKLTANPVLLARPKCPAPYQTESSKSLTDDEMNALLEVVKREADSGSIVGKRDYALLLLFFVTGLRRNEVIRRRGKDVEFKGEKLILKYRRKGGFFIGREVTDQEAIAALKDYLTASSREFVLGTSRALWTRHDRAGKPGAPLTSHAVAQNLKRYGEAAGIDNLHLHRTRHTYVRIVAETSGSITETQDALGHRNPATTRIYVQRIALKRNKYNGQVAFKSES